jgi:hypothetical protein
LCDDRRGAVVMVDRTDRALGGPPICYAKALGPPALCIPVPGIATRLQQFVQSDRPSCWPGIEKALLIRQMSDRLANPFCVNQGGQPFCGPTAVLFELIRKRPLRYIDICQQLYETGEFKGVSRTIGTTARLRQSQGNLRMAVADWLILATLRDANNILFPVDPNAPTFARNMSGITKPWEMVGWLREVMGYRHVKFRYSFFFGDLAGLQYAQEVIDRGGIALMLITTEQMLTAKPGTITMPNHWIALLGNVVVDPAPWPWQLDRGQVRFTAYSWGRSYGIDMPGPAFVDRFWGVAVAW